MEKLVIEAEYGGERLDVYVANNTEFTRSRIKKLADDGKITINGLPVKAKREIKESEIIQIEVPDPIELDVKAENLPIDIIYQDDDVAVINKEQGMTVHAGNGVHCGTLVNALLFHLDSLSGINGVIRPGIVHRIDKDTSGLLVVAKNDKAHVNLAKQIAEKTCKRTYWALLEGNLDSDEGKVETYLDRDKKDRTKYAVSSSGRYALTYYKVIQRYEGYTLCEFNLATGRTHQIRVHAKHLGHPIVGDPVYGYKKNKFGLNGQLLHAIRLQFVHPTTGKMMTFEAPLPDYFKKVLKSLKKQ